MRSTPTSEQPSLRIRGLRCAFGSADAVVPAAGVASVVELAVSSPLPQAKPYVVGITTWNGAPVIALGFGALVGSLSVQRLLLLTEPGALGTHLALVITAVRDFVDVQLDNTPVASSPPGSFFQKGRLLADDSLVRILAIDRMTAFARGTR